MAKISIVSTVWDTEKREYVNHIVEFTVSQEFVKKLAPEISKAISTSKVRGHSDGRQAVRRENCLNTPVANEKRYMISSSVMLYDDNGNDAGGFNGL
jgi:hypothetical protein